MKMRTLPPTTYQEALRRWQAALAERGTPQRLASEMVSLQEAAGRVPARILRTKLPAPAYAAAAMDGYAVAARRLEDASAAKPVRLESGVDAFPVDTGSAMPPGCDAIIPIESVEQRMNSILCFTSVAAGEHVRLAGEDVPPGVAIGRPGFSLRPLDCAALIACGDSSAEVVCRPRVTIIPTGNEIIAPGADATPGTAFESNSTMIAAAARLLGAQTDVTALQRDDAKTLASALRSAAEKSDVVVLLAGSARGGRDQSLGALSTVGKVVVRGVATRPARPVNLGLVGTKPVINLPGYPVAAQVAFELYVAPLLRLLGGHNEESDGRASVREPIFAAGDADEWRGVNLEAADEPAAIVPEDGHQSGLYSMIQSDALLHIERGQTRLSPGSHACIRVRRPLPQLREPLFVGPYDPLIEELAALLKFRCHWQPKATIREGEDNAGQLAGATAADPDSLKQAFSLRPDVEVRTLGRRIEGIAIQVSRWSKNGPRSVAAPPTRADGNAWDGAAAVAAGLAPAAACSAYVAHSFKLELIEARAIWYGMLWHKQLEEEKNWSTRLANALQQLRPAAQRLGWEQIGVSE